MLLNKGEFEGKRILSRKTVELMTINHLPDNQDMISMGSEGSFSEVRYKGVGFGLGFGVNIDLAGTQNSGSLGSYNWGCLLYTSPSPRDLSTSRMPSSA